MYLLDQYRGTVLSCRYAIPPGLAPAEARTQLEKAVKVAIVDVIMRHPMLQVGMIDAVSKTPSWIQLQSLDLTQHIKWSYVAEHEDFERVVQGAFCAQLDDRFPDLSLKQPGWKITIFRQGNAPIMEVLLTWNHTQFDGVGARVFHEDLLEGLNTENGSTERTGLDGDILKLPQTVPLLPTPIESLMCLPLDLKYLTKVIWDEIRPGFLHRDASQAAWCPIRSSPYKTRFRAFFVDQESLLKVLALCRKNKTTITGLMHGLALVAFSSNLNSTAAPAFQSSTVMDHRRNLPPAPPGAPWVRPDRTVANYVTQALHKYNTRVVKRIRSKLPPDDSKGRDLSADLLRELWAASARGRADVVRRLEAGLRNDLVGVSRCVTDWQRTMRGLAGTTRQLSWLVTNIGVLGGGGGGGASAKPSIASDTTTTTQSQDDGGDVKPGGDRGWSIGRAQFGLSAEVPAAAVEFSLVSVAGRGMCVSASWPDCAVDTVLGERIMADMERWLVQLAKQS